jgi:uncharacterized membrane protein YedE/YeeE
MTTDAGLGILDRTVPLDRIDAEAKQVNFRRGALTFIAAVLVAIGWTAAKACRVTLTVLGAGLSLMSIYAIIVSHWTAWQAARAEVAASPETE